jgi:hypothetical protein
MPTIDPTKVPTVNPGSLFSQLTSNTSLAVRWLTSADPAYFEAVNRPIADLALRQLIIAKTLDNINLQLGHQSLFPFLVQARVVGGSSESDLPASWIYDLHVSLPSKWENVRLARIKRISGTNGSSEGDFTGKLRLVFAASQEGTTTETSVFQIDYNIQSVLAYQRVRITVPTSSEEALVVPGSEEETINGFAVFRTLDPGEGEVQDFLEVLAPPLDTTADSSGEFITPAVYQMADEAAGGADVTNDYTLAGVAHGTGILLSSATNAIPPADSDVTTWINTFNYPFDADITLQSTSPSGIEIPQGLFKEFSIVAPASDEPTGDTSGGYFPVYISRIVKLDAPADTLVFYFATYNVEEPSIVPIEFATLTLERTMEAGDIVALIPIENLWPNHAGDAAWHQGFGKGYAMLSTVWSDSASTITDFFDSFLAVIGTPASVIYSKSATRLSSYSVSRVPQYVPTVGQAEALRGSLSGTEEPSIDNRYVVEKDQGQGTQVDFSVETSIPADKRTHAAIDRYGYTGALTHRIVHLVIDAADSTLDYETDVLPRLTVLLGRAPAFGDFWFDGTRLKFFDGSTFVG